MDKPPSIDTNHIIANQKRRYNQEIIRSLGQCHSKGIAAIPRVSAAVGEKNAIQRRKCEHRRTRRLASWATAKRSYLRTSDALSLGSTRFFRASERNGWNLRRGYGLPHQRARWFAMTKREVRHNILHSDCCFLRNRIDADERK